MRWILLVALFVPALALARTTAEAEAIARERIAPKLDLMCGAHLDVHYDRASLGPADVERACEQPLRFLYYACQHSEARHTIARAHLQRFTCRGAARDHGKVSVEHGQITLDVDPSDTSNRSDELATALQTTLSSSSLQMSSGPDDKWDAFVAAPVPVPTSTDFCIVDGKKMALPPTGDPLAPPHVRVRCVHHGKVVTEISAEGTGFVTQLDGNETHFDTYEKGIPVGERWVRANGILRERALMSGDWVWRSFYDERGKLIAHSNASTPVVGAIEFDEHGLVTTLECGSNGAADPVLRDWCGYDAPRRVTIMEPGNVRTVIMTNGKARIAE